MSAKSQADRDAELGAMAWVTLGLVLFAIAGAWAILTFTGPKCVELPAYERPFYGACQ